MVSFMGIKSLGSDPVAEFRDFNLSFCLSIKLLPDALENLERLGCANSSQYLEYRRAMLCWDAQVYGSSVSKAKKS